MKYETTIDGCVIRYWEFHPEADDTIVLIHGFTGSHEGFQYIIPLLREFRLIIPDLPGFGESELMPREEWTIEAIAARTNHFIKQLGLKRPYILGHSMGGLVVSAMLAAAPQLYARQVILVSPVPTAIRRNDRRRPGAILGALQYGLGYRVPKVGERIVKSRHITRAVTRIIMTTSDRELRKAIHRHHQDNLKYISSIEFYSKLHRDINRRGAIDYQHALSGLDVLLVLGQRDDITPLKEQYRLIEAIHPSEVEIIPGVGHLAHYETPRHVADAVRHFLR